MSFMYVDVSPAPLVKACERLRRGHRIWLNSMNFQIQADSFFFYTQYMYVLLEKALYYIPSESMWLCV